MDQIKSRQRVSEHGEVFTPPWLVEIMFDLVKEESMRIDSRILEPACGSGRFLEVALVRKLRTVKEKYGSSDFELRQKSILGLMCLYGIEKLTDNAEECRSNLIKILNDFFPEINNDDDFFQACKFVVSKNIIEGNAMTLENSDGEPILFPEWAYLGTGKFQRRDFSLKTLEKNSKVKAKNSLFSHFDIDEVYGPVKEYEPVTIKSLADVCKSGGDML